MNRRLTPTKSTPLIDRLTSTDTGSALLFVLSGGEMQRTFVWLRKTADTVFSPNLQLKEETFTKLMARIVTAVFPIDGPDEGNKELITGSA